MLARDAVEKVSCVTLHSCLIAADQHGDAGDRAAQ
jgi:hypothetical protein